VTLYVAKYRIESARLRGWYFATICTHNRASLFGEVVRQEVRLSPIGLLAASELRSLGSH